MAMTPKERARRARARAEARKPLYSRLVELWYARAFDSFAIEDRDTWVIRVAPGDPWAVVTRAKAQAFADAFAGIAEGTGMFVPGIGGKGRRWVRIGPAIDLRETLKVAA